MRAFPTADLLNNVNGLPTHALLVHFTVVIATGGALGGVAYALVPRFRRWLSVPLGFVGVASVVLGIVTPSSGEQLEARTPPSALLEKHTELGGQMGTILIVYGVVLMLTVVVVRYRRRGDGEAGPAPTPVALDRIGGLPGDPGRAFPGQAALAAGLTVLTLASAIVSGVWIYRTGDAGARSVWADTPKTAQAAQTGPGR